MGSPGINRNRSAGKVLGFFPDTGEVCGVLSRNLGKDLGNTNSLKRKAANHPLLSDLPGFSIESSRIFNPPSPGTRFARILWAGLLGPEDQVSEICPGFQVFPRVGFPLEPARGQREDNLHSLSPFAKPVQNCQILVILDGIP